MGRRIFQEVLGDDEGLEVARSALYVAQEEEEEIAVVILNRNGIVSASLTMNGAIRIASELAEKKARLALGMEMPTSDLSEEDVADFGTNYSTFPGGIPFGERNDPDFTILGAIGVSGLSGEEDEAIAIKAVQRTPFREKLPAIYTEEEEN